MREATAFELTGWDELIVRNPDGGQILQTRAWGEFKRRHGWLPKYLVGDLAGGRVAMLALRRRVLGVGELWYLPKGPGVADLEQLAGLVEQLRSQPRVFAVKVEPEIEDSPSATTELKRLGLTKSRRDVQITRATIIVEIGDDDEALLASFKPKTRYNIRLAARRGVHVEAVPATDSNVDTMYALMASTRDRAGFTLRPKAYFRGYWQLQEAAGQGQLFFARLDGEVLAGLYATFLGTKAWYKALARAGIDNFRWLAIVQPRLVIALGLDTYGAMKIALHGESFPCPRNLREGVVESFRYLSSDVWCQAHPAVGGYHRTRAQVAEDWRSMAARIPVVSYGAPG